MTRMTVNNFKKILEQIHPNLDFSNSRYVSASQNIKFICSTHREVSRSPSDLKFKGGCPKCGNEKSGKSKSGKETFIDRSSVIHRNKYNYSKVIYLTARKNVTIVCPIHGEFEQTPSRHISGRGCPVCGRSKPGKNIIKKINMNFTLRCTEIHGDKYNYSKSIYKGNSKHIEIFCNKHKSFFTQTAGSHLSGAGCPKCGIETTRDSKVKTTKHFIERAKVVHEDRYDYSKSNYKSCEENITIICPTHGNFEQTPGNHTNIGKQQGCPRCAVTFSTPEQELREFIESLGFETSKLRIPTKPSHREIDIFIKEKSIGIEFNGLYFHSDKFKSNSYHINKTKLAEENKIELIHVWENDWAEKKYIIKSRLKAILGKSTRIFARKTEIKELSWKETTIFLNDHHLKGPGQTSKIRYGLIYENQLVGVMTAGNARFNNKGLEIYRYASSGQVVGGMSKLLKHIERQHKPTLIVSFADRCWGPGKVYEAIGFEKISESKPSYVWVKSMRVKSRFSMQKHKLHTILKDFDPSMSEAENCHANGWYKLYDCGTVKWEKQL